MSTFYGAPFVNGVLTLGTFRNCQIISGVYEYLQGPTFYNIGND